MPAWAQYTHSTNSLRITCQVCNNIIPWKPSPPIVSVPSMAIRVRNIRTLSLTCPFLKNDNTPCRASYDIKYDTQSNQVISVNLSPMAWRDGILIEMGRKWMENTISVLDKRAEYMVTTIVGLIAVNFGIIVAFDISNIAIKLVPNAFLSISALFLVLSHFPKTSVVHLDDADEIQKAYEENVGRKYELQKWGYTFFIVALMAIAITASFSLLPTADPVSKVSLNGNITLFPPP